MPNEQKCGRCMKHDPTWASKSQYVVNKLRDTVIKAKYHSRFINLLCTCPSTQNPPRNDSGGVWETVTDDMFNEALNTVTNYVETCNDKKVEKCMKDVFKSLVKDGELKTQGSGYAPVQPKTSTLRMMYLLQQGINKNDTIFHPPRHHQITEKTKKSHRFEVPGLQPQHIGVVIGYRGFNLAPFRTDHKCGVTLDTVDDKVFATIEKKCVAEREVQELEPKLIIFINKFKADNPEDFEDRDENNSDDDPEPMEEDTPANNIQMNDLSLGTSANQNSEPPAAANQKSEPQAAANQNSDDNVSRRRRLQSEPDDCEPCPKQLKVS